MSSGNDELSNSKHGSVAKALVGDRSLGGGDKFDALVQGARSSSGAQDEPTDRFDAMVRGVRSSAEGDELGSSKHGSVAKALVGDRDVAMKRAKSMNATTGGGVGRFDSMRRHRPDDLGRSLNGRGRATFGCECDDDLGGSKHGGADKALNSPYDHSSPRDLFGRNRTATTTATTTATAVTTTARTIPAASSPLLDRFDSMFRKARGEMDDKDNGNDRRLASLPPPPPAPSEGRAGSTREGGAGSTRVSAMDVLKEIVRPVSLVTCNL